MSPPLWMRCLRLYARRCPIMRGKARLSKLAFHWFPVPDGPFAADVDEGTTVELWPWIWADYCTYVIGSPEIYHLQYMRTRLRPDHTVFDIGAYIGTYSLAASRLVPEGHVHAFEPNPHSADRMRQALRRSKIANVTLCRAAMSVSPQDEATVVLDTYPPRSAIAGAESTSAETIETPVWSVDRYCEAASVASVDLMKIDVEGAEMDVLRGAQNIVQTHHPEILLEVHPPLLRRHGYTVDDIVAFLDAAAYHFFEMNFGLTRPRLAPLSGEGVIEAAGRQPRKIIIARHSVLGQ